MIIIMKPQATEEQIGSLCHDLSRQGMQVQRNAGVDCTVLGVLGDTTQVDPDSIELCPGALPNRTKRQTANSIRRTASSIAAA